MRWSPRPTASRGRAPRAGPGASTLVVLDLMLPRLQRSRRAANAARRQARAAGDRADRQGEVEDRVAGLDAGRGRLPRQAVLGRRAGSRGSAPSCAPRPATSANTAGGRRTRGRPDLTRKVVSVDGAARCALSTTEFELLVYLMRNRGQVLVARADPERRLGLRARPGDEHRRRLRRLSAAQAEHRRTSPAPITTVRAVGYRFDAGALRRGRSRSTSLRWRLAAWVALVVVVCTAVTFVVVYRRHRQPAALTRSTPSSPATRSSFAHALPLAAGLSPQALLRVSRAGTPRRSRYKQLDAAVRDDPGRRDATNHPELFGSDRARRRRDVWPCRRRRTVLGRRLLQPRPGYSTREAPDVGKLRLLRAADTRWRATHRLRRCRRRR